MSTSRETAATRRARRAARRVVGRREITRRARTLATRIFELAEQGYSPTAIASSVGLSEETVLAVLEEMGQGEVGS